MGERRMTANDLGLVGLAMAAVMAPPQHRMVRQKRQPKPCADKRAKVKAARKANLRRQKP